MIVGQDVSPPRNMRKVFQKIPVEKIRFEPQKYEKFQRLKITSKGLYAPFEDLFPIQVLKDTCWLQRALMKKFRQTKNTKNTEKKQLVGV